jgi:hypothetical protein
MVDVPNRRGDTWRNVDIAGSGVNFLGGFSGTFIQGGMSNNFGLYVQDNCLLCPDSSNSNDQSALEVPVPNKEANGTEIQSPLSFHNSLYLKEEGFTRIMR